MVGRGQNPVCLRSMPTLTGQARTCTRSEFRRGQWAIWPTVAGPKGAEQPTAYLFPLALQRACLGWWGMYVQHGDRPSIVYNAHGASGPHIPRCPMCPPNSIHVHGECVGGCATRRSEVRSLACVMMPALCRHYAGVAPGVFGPPRVYAGDLLGVGKD